MFTILTAPFRALTGLIVLLAMIIMAVALYLIVNNEIKRKALIEHCQRRLCAVLLRCLNVEIHYVGAPNSQANVFAANHISWLDTLLFMPAPRVRFIAKSEVKSWPIIGLLAQLLGTVFIRRDNKFQVYRSLPNAQRHLCEGNNLVIFPEGIATKGQDTLPFHPMLFEIAKRENRLVQPVAIRYSNHAKNTHQTARFVGHDNPLNRIIKLLFERKTVAHVHFLPVLNPTQLSRKQLAHHAQLAINQVLKQAHLTPPDEHCRDATGRQPVTS